MQSAKTSPILMQDKITTTSKTNSPNVPDSAPEFKERPPGICVRLSTIDNSKILNHAVDITIMGNDGMTTYLRVIAMLKAYISGGNDRNLNPSAVPQYDNMKNEMKEMFTKMGFNVCDLPPELSFDSAEKEQEEEFKDVDFERIKKLLPKPEDILKIRKEQELRREDIMSEIPSDVREYFVNNLSLEFSEALGRPRDLHRAARKVYLEELKILEAKSMGMAVPNFKVDRKELKMKEEALGLIPSINRDNKERLKFALENLKDNVSKGIPIDTLVDMFLADCLMLGVGDKYERFDRTLFRFLVYSLTKTLLTKYFTKETI